MSDLDLGRVAELVALVAREELVPRWKALAPHEIFSKSTPENPGDLCTEADLAAERRLREGLLGLSPSARFLGEEEASADPTLLALLGGDDPVWVVDPLDGTRNFAAGLPTFGTMVALVRRREVVAAIIHLPLEPATFVAEAGSGAYLDGRRLRRDGDAPRAILGGSVYTRFMPPELRDSFEGRSFPGLEERPAAGASAIEYAALARGWKDFVLYHRLLPWDHAPGSLVLAEAGGAARHPDGAPYRPGDGRAQSLLVASAEDWERARAALFG